MRVEKTVALPGCTPEPLAGYLKSLGVLRLVAEQKDPGARGSWSGTCFVLHTVLGAEGIVRFFLEEYEPTPILAPWNSASGFWAGTTPSAVAALEALRVSTSPRLARYREAISRTDAVLQAAGLRGKPHEQDKARILRLLRSALPDEAIRWMDAACALAEDRAVFAPLLGTGGNDGRLEFSVNFMQRLRDVIPLDAGGWGVSRRGRRSPDPYERSRNWLEASLFGTGSPEMVAAAVGQFHPGGVGGPNATRGFEGPSLVNPWDYILMIEGALLLAGSVVKRAGDHGRRGSAFPFTVRLSAAGAQVLAPSDVALSRQEVWLPLWDRPAGLHEVTHVLAEGRAQVGRRPAATGADFARAVAGLGVERGLSGFQRFAFVRRSGKAYISVPLGRLRVREVPAAHLLEQLDAWLSRLGRALRRKTAPESFRRAARAIEDAVFRFCQDGRPQALQEVLTALARAERVVARSRELREEISPVPPLDPEWLEACDDGSTEFRLARSIASLEPEQGRYGAPAVLPMRGYLLPVRPVPGRRGWYAWYERSCQAVWGPGGPVTSMVAVLRRRCLDARSGGAGCPAPVAGRAPAQLADIQRFLDGRVDEARLGDLVCGLSLVNWDLAPPLRADADAPPAISRLYALCKLMFHHGPLPVTTPLGGNPVAVADPVLISHLELGAAHRATELAVRRLRGAGLTVLGICGGRAPGRLPEILCPPGHGLRVAAALLFPLGHNQVARLADLVLRA